MNTQTFLNLDLVLHITGFTMMAGTIVADCAINRRMKRFLLSDKQRAVSILDVSAGFPRLIGIGAALLIVTGFAMVVIFKNAVADMRWFRIKMVVVVLILVNGAVILRRGSNRMKRLLEANDERNNAIILSLNHRLGLFPVTS